MQWVISAVPRSEMPVYQDSCVQAPCLSQQPACTSQAINVLNKDMLLSAFSVPGSSMAVAVAQRSSPLNRCASGRGELSGGADHGRDARTRSCHTACSDRNLACSSAIFESMVSSTTQPSAPCVCSASSSSSCHTRIGFSAWNAMKMCKC